jgi:hypothetical protein
VPHTSPGPGVGQRRQTQTTLLGVDITAYTALWALALNLVVAGALTLALRALGQRETADETSSSDYDELVETGRAAPVMDAPTG